ncbi:MAG: DUF2318 domain-containing protein [Clostridia bacterium]|nr:DUF2318 domain-containing protein [Clostridia bacterium]
MKKSISFVLVIILACALLSACSNNGDPVGENTGDAARSAKYTELQPDDSGTVTILTDGVTKTARFFNYDADGVTVQLVALRDKKDGVHIAFNTCQSCSPSPKAYYQQSGGVLKCTNCGFTFEPEQVGITAGGCNPWPIDGVSIGENEIKIPVSSLDGMRSTFTSWAGPTK